MLRVSIALCLIAAPAAADVQARLEDSGVCDPTPLPERVDVLLGRAAFADDASLIVELATTTEGDRIRGTIVIGDRGRRVIEARDCTELVESAALVIAMVLSQPVPATRPVRAIEPPAIEETAPLPLRIRGELFAGLAGGRAGKDVQGAAVFGVGIRRGKGSFGLELQLTAPDRVTVQPGHIVVTTGVIEGVACRHRSAIAVCATGAVGWISGRGVDLREVTSATTPYAALGARLGWQHALTSGTALRAHLGVRAPLTRNRFLVDAMTVWSTAPVEAWLGVSAIAQFP